MIVRHIVNYHSVNLPLTFAAIGDPTRLAILARLEAEGPSPVSRLAEPFRIKLPAVMKHLDVLGDAGLIVRRKSGRVVMVTLQPDRLQEAWDWLARYERFWTPRLDRLVAYVETQEAKKT